MVRKCPARPTPIDSRALASRLGCSYKTLVNLTRSFGDRGRRNVLAFQAYGFATYLLPRRHRTAKCSAPQRYVVSRRYIDLVSGRARSHWRKAKRGGDWQAYLSYLKKLAFGQLIRGRIRADAKHKASPQRESGAPRLARGPPKKNRRACRRSWKLAGGLQREYDQLGGPWINLYGWLMRRLAEEHDRARIVACLRHAIAVMPRGRYAPVNKAAWVCEVARRHLDSDGLAPIQRWQDRQAREQKPGRHALRAAYNEGSRLPNSIDADGCEWQHLGGTKWEKING